MMEKNKSLATLERGVTENTGLQVAKTCQSYFEDKFNMNCYYTKKDGAWNFSLYNNKRHESSRKWTGKGKDMHDAVMDLRKQVIHDISVMEGLESPFTNLYEIDLISEKRNKIQRNDVGAVIEEDESMKDVVTSLVAEMRNLKEYVESLNLKK
jgi:hypothetical protein